MNLSSGTADGDESVTLSEVLGAVRLAPDKPLADQVFTILHEAIVHIQFKPGQLLSEKETAEALGASKTPVREAFIRLAAAGLLEIIPKSGSYVSRISINRFLEARFIRLELESATARRAAGRHGNFLALVRLEACVKQQMAARDRSDFEAFASLDDDFHKLIFEMAGLPGAWSFMRQSQADVDRIRHLKRRYGIRRTDAVIREHAEIVASLRAGSPERAESAVRAHLGSLDDEIDALAARPDLLDYIEQLNRADTRGGAADAMRRSA